MNTNDLYGTSFNKVALREPMRDVEPRQMPVDDLDQDPTVLQPQSFLSNDILGEFSPRNISDDRELPLEKEGFVPFLCDDGEVEEIEGLNEFRPPADMLADAITVTAEPIDPQQLPLEQLISIPGSIMLDDELEAFESSPLAPDNAWQENAPFSVCTQLETTPLSPTNQAILLPLEEDKHQFNHQPFSLTQHMLGVEQVFRPNASVEDIYSRPLQADSSPSKPSRKIGRHLKKGTSQGAKTREEPHLRPPAAQKVLKKKTSGRRKAGANAHLSLEERKRLRAERNRESAEKSRMRRKQMVLDLETNVAFLREENRDLKAKVEQHHEQLTSASEEVNRRAAASGEGAEETSMKVPILYEALSALQRCIEQCPRTFNRGPQTPVIPLNISRTGRR